VDDVVLNDRTKSVGRFRPLRGNILRTELDEQRHRRVLCIRHIFSFLRRPENTVSSPGRTFINSYRPPNRSNRNNCLITNYLNEIPVRQLRAPDDIISAPSKR